MTRTSTWGSTLHLLRASTLLVRRQGGEDTRRGRDGVTSQSSAVGYLTRSFTSAPPQCRPTGRPSDCMHTFMTVTGSLPNGKLFARDTVMSAAKRVIRRAGVAITVRGTSWQPAAIDFHWRGSARVAAGRSWPESERESERAQGDVRAEQPPGGRPWWGRFTVGGSPSSPKSSLPKPARLSRLKATPWMNGLSTARATGTLTTGPQPCAHVKTLILKHQRGCWGKRATRMIGRTVRRRPMIAHTTTRSVVRRRGRPRTMWGDVIGYTGGAGRVGTAGTYDTVSASPGWTVCRLNGLAVAIMTRLNTLKLTRNCAGYGRGGI